MSSEEQAEDFTALPLADRLQHKVWKARVSAYEEAAKQFAASPDENDACFKLWLADPTIWKKAVTDSNVVAQEAALTALNAFLEFGGPNAGVRTRSHVVPSLVEKCLASTRAGTRGKAIDACAWYVELDTPEPVLEDIFTLGLGHKLPKTIAASAACVTALVRQFGAQTMGPKLLVKQTPRLFAHTDKNVRKEANDLACELYRWLGDGVRPLIIAELKPIQAKELEAAFDGIRQEGDKPRQPRLLRSQRAAQETFEEQPTGEAEAGTSDAPGSGTDAYDLADPVDVFAKIPKDFEDQMASAKWKDRKEALEALLSAAQVARISEAPDYSDIMRTLAKSMKDANILCVSVAANCVEAFANGLRNEFARYKPIVLGPMLERFKEKKANVVDALSRACNAVFRSSGLSAVLEETVEFTQHKNPQIKQESLNFLTRCLESTTEFPTKGEQKLIAETATKLLGDTFEPVRLAAAQVTGTLMKIIGERAMNPYLEKVDDLRKPKIMEFFEKSVIHARPPKAAAPVTGTAPSSAMGNAATARPTGSSSAPRTRIVKRTVAGSAASPLKPRPSGRPSGTSVQASSSSRLPSSTPVSRSALSSPDRTWSSQTQSRTSTTNRSLTSRALQKPSSSSGGMVDGSSSSLGSSIQARRAELNEQERKELDELRSVRYAMEHKVSGLETENQTLKMQLEQLQTETQNLLNERSEHIHMLAARDSQITGLQNEISSARVSMAKQQQEMETLQKGLARSAMMANSTTSPDPYSRSHSRSSVEEKENIPVASAEPQYGSYLRQSSNAARPGETSASAIKTFPNSSLSAPGPTRDSKYDGTSTSSSTTKRRNQASNLTEQLKEKITQMRKLDRERPVSRARVPSSSLSSTTPSRSLDRL